MLPSAGFGRSACLSYGPEGSDLYCHAETMLSHRS